MNKKIIIICVTLNCFYQSLKAQQEAAPQLGKQAVSAVLDSVSHALLKCYVFKDSAMLMVAGLQKQAMTPSPIRTGLPRSLPLISVGSFMTNT